MSKYSVERKKALLYFPKKIISKKILKPTFVPSINFYDYNGFENDSKHHLIEEPLIKKIVYDNNNVSNNFRENTTMNNAFIEEDRSHYYESNGNIEGLDNDFDEL